MSVTTAAAGAASTGRTGSVRSRRRRWRRARPTPAIAPWSIGFGPTGRTVVRLLRDNGVTPTVVELNVDTVRELRQEGIEAVYGDATRPETLEAAGVAHGGQPHPRVGRHGPQRRT